MLPVALQKLLIIAAAINVTLSVVARERCHIKLKILLAANRKSFYGLKESFYSEACLIFIGLYRQIMDGCETNSTHISLTLAKFAVGEHTIRHFILRV